VTRKAQNSLHGWQQFRQRHITLICRLHTATAVALLCHRQSRRTAYRPCIPSLCVNSTHSLTVRTD